MVNALKNGEIDVVATNYTVCRYEQEAAHDQLQAVLIETMPIVYMLRLQDRALQQKLNGAIDALWRDGTLYSIKLKYLHPLEIEPARF